jgi:hypothetical protein
MADDYSPRYTPIPEMPDFYFGQEDFLIEFQKGKKWKYTVYRPMVVNGATKGNHIKYLANGLGNGMSFASSLAVYFTVQKYLGKKAIYPGNEVSYRGLNSFSSADIVAQFAVWASTNPQAENNDFIIIDDDNNIVTTEQLWKAGAAYFGVEVEEPTFPNTSSLPKVQRLGTLSYIDPLGCWTIPTGVFYIRVHER